MTVELLGLVLALGGAGALAGSIMAGRIVRSHGSGRSAVIAAAGLAMTVPLIGVAPSAGALALVLAAVGFLDAVADVGMNAVAIRVEEGLARSIMSRLHGLWSLGSLFGAGVATLAVLGGVGLASQLAVLSVASLAAVMIVARMIPKLPSRAGTRNGRWAAGTGLLLSGVAVAFLEGLPHDWGAVFLVDETGAGGAVAGTGILILSLGHLVGRMGGDHLVDRFRAAPTLVTGVVLSLIAAGIVALSSSPGTAIVGLGAWGLGVSVAFPVLYKLAGAHRGFGEGSGLGALVFGNRLGFIAQPALVGAGAAVWGLPFAVAATVTVAAAASLIALRLTLGRTGAVAPASDSP